jgi:antitoxin ChpS
MAQTTTLRKVGGSVMLTIPPSLLDELNLHAGSTVSAEVKEGRLVVQHTKPRYTLEELLAQCVGDQTPTAEEREWLDAPAVGREII